MLLVTGILAAPVERTTSGQGQVVDAAMVDGVSTLKAMAWGLRAGGDWQDERGVNLLDGGAPFYDTYRCRDGGYLAIGALEPQFWARQWTALRTRRAHPRSPRGLGVRRRRADPAGAGRRGAAGLRSPAHQPRVPGAPLKGPTTSVVTQPP
jgi:crotonobetainyl-CoA:carnitine CoA-transferase CaiB-like acyl-CoA transferase